MSLLARFAVFLVAVGALLMVGQGQRPAHAATVTVNIGDDFYSNSMTNNCGSPCVTNISAGDTVHWVWIGSLTHSTTSDVGSTEVWDSMIFGNGHTFNHTFMTAGSFSYHCNVHPTMHGTIVVSGSASVGGIAELPGAANAPLAESVPAGSDHTGLVVGSIATAAGVVAFAGAAWYARRRRSL